jgi:FKBP-type peptidyl-prolyl cis-trans isomerase FkpA
MINLRMSIRLFLAALMLVNVACSDDITGGPVDPADLTFASALGVNLSQMTRTPSGLYMRDEVVGTGAVATVGSTVIVDYTGWLHTGVEFDSSARPGRIPLEFGNLGNAQVIQGWNEGLVGMRVGGRRLLVIPSSLGYGERGSGSAIPPYATLVFRVQLRSATPR